MKEEFTVKDVYHYDQRTPAKWIISHVKRYYYFPVLVLLASIINSFSFSNIQVFIGRGFDTITGAQWHMADLLWIALSIVGLAFLQGLSGLGRNFSVEFLAQRLERNTRAELYRSLLGKSQTFHSKQQVGDLMARATNDVRQLNMMFSPGVMLITDSSLTLIVPVIMIGTIHPLLLIVPAFFTLFLTLTVWDYNRRLKPVSINQREQFGKMNAGLTESINGIEVVKSYVRENYELKKFFFNAEKYRDYFVEQGIIQAKYWPMMVFAVTWGAAFFHGLYLWKLNIISLGDVVAFMGLVGVFRFITFISIFSFNLVQLGMASADRILTLMKTETEMDQNEGGISQEIKGAVTFENVSFSFNGKKVLENINFTVQPGQTVAIVGQTGSGKTTMTRLINRIFDVAEGRVLVDGIDVRDWSLESLRSQISTIEQDVFLFSRSIKENIAFGMNIAKDDHIIRAAKEAQADSFIRKFKDGYDTEIGERGVTLSGGQKQRLAIARAFLTHPRILILDDSTSAIDSQTEDEIQRAMKRISSERTTFIITHRLSQIRWADRILLLKNGTVIEQGSHEELLERSIDYNRIFATI